MRMPNSKGGYLLKVNKTYEAEGLEQKLRRITENKEPIEAVAPIIYTDKKNGVMPEFDIRTDRFEVAMEAMGKVRKSELAKMAKSEEMGGTIEGKNVGQEPS